MEEEENSFESITKTSRGCPFFASLRVRALAFAFAPCTRVFFVAVRRYGEIKKKKKHTHITFRRTILIYIRLSVCELARAEFLRAISFSDIKFIKIERPFEF